MRVTSKQIQDFVANQPYHMIVMYKNGCPPCENMKKQLGDKLKQYDIITFLERSEVDDDFLDYFPHVHIYEYGKHRDGTLKELYTLLNVNTL
jgi:thioredoxin-related protein